MKKIIILLISSLLCWFPFSGQSFAGDKEFSLSFTGQYIPIFAGDAGSGGGAPEYDDAFESGFGVSMEAAYRINARFSLLGGIGYEHYSGNSPEDISFDRLEVIPVYLGFKYHFAKKRLGWNPYLRADIGMARIASVDISYMGEDARYWDSSWEFMFDLGAGTEYRFNALAIFAEIRGRYIGEPDAAFPEYSDADASWSLPVIFGVSYFF